MGKKEVTIIYTSPTRDRMCTIPRRPSYWHGRAWPCLPDSRLSPKSCQPLPAGHEYVLGHLSSRKWYGLPAIWDLGCEVRQKHLLLEGKDDDIFKETPQIVPSFPDCEDDMTFGDNYLYLETAPACSICNIFFATKNRFCLPSRLSRHRWFDDFMETYLQNAALLRRNHLTMLP